MSPRGCRMGGRVDPLHEVRQQTAVHQRPQTSNAYKGKIAKGLSRSTLMTALHVSGPRRSSRHSNQMGTFFHSLYQISLQSLLLHPIYY